MFNSVLQRAEWNATNEKKQMETQQIENMHLSLHFKKPRCQPHLVLPAPSQYIDLRQSRTPPTDWTSHETTPNPASNNLNAPVPSSPGIVRVHNGR